MPGTSTEKRFGNWGGYGRLLKALATSDIEFNELVGVDTSSVQITTAKKFLRGLNVKLEQADVSKGLPFPDKHFDLVYTSGVLMHIPNKHYSNVVKEIIRVSRKFIVHNEDLTRGVPKYGHDNYLTYRKLGYDVEIVKDAPSPKGQKMQFIVVKL